MRLHAEDVTDEIGELSLQRDGEWICSAGDVLPIQANGEQAEAFITVRSTEDVREVDGILVGETED